jgi:hypothetical protein
MRTDLSLVLAALLLACNRPAPAPDTDPELTQAATFVRAFYAWYLPAAGTGAGLQRAIVDSVALFAPDLVRAIEADGEAQAKNQDEVVGLDGDPFLDAQDFCERYDVGAVRRDGNDVLVDVHARCAGQDDSIPRITARLQRTERGWIFTNFHYPQRTSDLLKDLDELRRQRDSAR